MTNFIIGDYSKKSKESYAELAALQSKYNNRRKLRAKYRKKIDQLDELDRVDEARMRLLKDLSDVQDYLDLAQKEIDRYEKLWIQPVEVLIDGVTSGTGEWVTDLDTKEARLVITLNKSDKEEETHDEIDPENNIDYTGEDS